MRPEEIKRTWKLFARSAYVSGDVFASIDRFHGGVQIAAADTAVFVYMCRLRYCIVIIIVITRIKPIISETFGAKTVVTRGTRFLHRVRGRNSRAHQTRPDTIMLLYYRRYYYYYRCYYTTRTSADKNVHWNAYPVPHPGVGRVRVILGGLLAATRQSTMEENNNNINNNGNKNIMCIRRMCGVNKILPLCVVARPGR